MKDDIGVGAHVGDIPLDLNPKRAIEADHVAQILTDLGRIYVNTAHEFEAIALGDQPSRSATNGSEPILNYANFLCNFRCLSLSQDSQFLAEYY